MHINAWFIIICTTFRVGDDLKIKVADFGLARDVRIKEYYRQQSNGKIPVRWMAPETLHTKISNEKSDVVSLYCSKKDDQKIMLLKVGHGYKDNFKIR